MAMTTTTRLEWIRLATLRLLELDAVISARDSLDLAAAIADRADWRSVAPEAAVEAALIREGRRTPEPPRQAA